MPEDNLDVHTLSGDAEYESFARLAVSTFYPQVTEQAVADFSDRATTSPDVLAGELRGIVDSDGTVLAGYVMMVRRLCIDSARLATGCVGAVAVRPERRGQGLGVRLMEDAIAFAGEQNLALLLLTGIADWYHRFGFVPVLLETDVTLKREDARGLPAPAGCTVREAAPADASILLALYRQHLQPIAGAFDRGLDQQRVIQQRRIAPGRLGYLLAEDAAGAPTGYLMFIERADLFSVREVAAGDWPTIAALLKEHDRRIPAPGGESEAPDELRWQVPLHSPLYFEMIDRLPCRTSALHHPSADWMARLVSLDAFLHSMLPLWSQRTARAGRTGRQMIRVDLEDEAFALEIRPEQVRRVAAATAGEAAATMAVTRADLLQLAFAFRPPDWIARRPGRRIPAELMPLLETLFPSHPAGISGSDYF